VDVNLETSPTAGLRERGKQRRTTQILAAARELLRQFPEEPLTVERIAARAELSPPTVFNLVGPRDKIWAALADQALGDLDLTALRTIDDPQQRARSIVAAVISMVCDDAPVFRALLANWKDSARLIDHDPTGELLACLREASDRNGMAPRYDMRRLAELISAGMIGLMHQWAAGLMSNRALRARGSDLVDIAFAAAWPPRG
jgi:AcrR family transcriptional regulator